MLKLSTLWAKLPFNLVQFNFMNYNPKMVPILGCGETKLNETSSLFSSSMKSCCYASLFQFNFIYVPYKLNTDIKLSIMNGWIQPNNNVKDINFSETWSKGPLTEWEQYWQWISLNSEWVKTHGGSRE